MCMRCNGFNEEEVFESYRNTIQSHGWVVIAVQGDEAESAFAYTLGLTRFHGHPELLVSGMDQSVAGAMLNDLGNEVALGSRFVPGQLVRGVGQQRFQFVQVDDPGQLIEAQEMYASEAGLVPAIQVVHSDHDGRWPWERGRRNPGAEQPLFGTPMHW